MSGQASSLGCRNHIAWTVKLTGVPVIGHHPDIVQAICQEQYKPRQIEIGRPTYSTDSEKVLHRLSFCNYVFVLGA